MSLASPRLNLLFALLAALIAAMPLYAPGYWMDLVSTALIAAMFALSLQLLVGGTGLVSLAHAAFFGLGAYAVHLATGVLGAPPSIAITFAAAALLAGAAALVIGALALRTRGFFFLMTTLAFGQVLFFVFHDTPLGGGTDGLFIPRPAFEVAGLALPVTRANRPAVLLLLNLAVLAAMYAGLHALMGTLFGRALQGIRANEHRMRATGHNVQGLKLAAFAIAGMLAGIAGHMEATTNAFVNPELLGWHRSAGALLMILLGGISTLHGPIVGAFAFTALAEASRSITERQALVEGLVILAVVLALPGGLAGLRRPAR
jgi:branched-chain amino acid transport system permease protein